MAGRHREALSGSREDRPVSESLGFAYPGTSPAAFTDLEVEAADHLAVVLPATESTPGRFPRPGELAAVAKALTHTESLARDIVPLSCEAFVRPLAAYAVACALDDLLWTHGDPVLCDPLTSALEVSTDTVYGIQPGNPRGWLGEQPLNTNPTNLPTHDLGQSPHWRMGVTADYRVVLDSSHADDVAPILRDAICSVVLQPTLDLSAKEYSITRTSTPPTYVNLGPTANGTRVQRMLRAATKDSAALVVLHEYGLAERHVESVTDALQDCPRSVLLAAGVAADQDDAGVGASGARIWGRHAGSHASTPTWTLRLPAKRHDAPLRELATQVDGSRRTIIFDERIHLGSELRVLRAHEFTVAVVVCMDALDPTLGPLLEQLGVNLVVIPAMTTKTASMVNLASHLVAARQAFVVLANGPASMPGQRRGSPGRQEACFLGPYAAPTAALYPRADALPGPRERGWWSFRWSEAHGTWEPLHR